MQNVLVSCSHTYTPFPSFVTLVTQIIIMNHSPSCIIAYIIPYDDFVRYVCNYRLVFCFCPGHNFILILCVKATKVYGAVAG